MVIKRMGYGIPESLTNERSKKMMQRNSNSIRKPTILWNEIPRYFFVESILPILGVVVFICFGALLTARYLSPSAVTFVVMGMIIGVLPSVVAALPARIELKGERSLAWRNQIRYHLARSSYLANLSSPEGSEEYWRLEVAWWKKWWPGDVSIRSSEGEIEVRGPKTVLFQLWRRL